MNQRQLEGLYNSLRLYYALHLHYVETAIPNLGNVDTCFNRHFTQVQIAFPYMMNPSLVPRIGERPSNLFKLYTDMTSRKLPHTGHEYWMIRVIFEHSHMTVHNVQIRYCLLQGTMVTQKFL